MKFVFNSLLLIISSLVISNNVFACGSEPPGSSENNKGNYLCTGCVDFSASLGGMDIAFIKSEVNSNIDRWRPGDFVTLTNGRQWATYTYRVTGQHYIVASGSGVGVGEPVNHDGSGFLTCDQAEALSQAFGGGAGSGTSTDHSLSQTEIALILLARGERSTSVTMTDLPPLPSKNPDPCSLSEFLSGRDDEC